MHTEHVWNSSFGLLVSNILLYCVALCSRSSGYAPSSRLVQNNIWRQSAQKQIPNMLLSLQLLNEEMMLLSWIRKLFSKKEETDPMKYLFVGLGNMGAEYDDTRHNVGFEIVDALAKELRGKWEHEQLGDLTTVKHKGRTLILLKPSTYMNLSGKSVRYWMQKKKILPENLLVIVDDLNLEFGKIRLRGKGSDGGHNGLRDIQQYIGNDYARLRIGIGADFGRGRQVDHVLGKWDKKELEQLQDVIFRACTSAKGFATIGLKHAMSQFNG